MCIFKNRSSFDLLNSRSLPYGGLIFEYSFKMHYYLLLYIDCQSGRTAVLSRIMWALLKLLVNLWISRSVSTWFFNWLFGWLINWSTCRLISCLIDIVIAVCQGQVLVTSSKHLPELRPQDRPLLAQHLVDHHRWVAFHLPCQAGEDRRRHLEPWCHRLVSHQPLLVIVCYCYVSCDYQYLQCVFSLCQICLWWFWWSMQWCKSRFDLV